MLKIGLCGAGFGHEFGVLLQAHPLVESVSIAELDSGKRELLANRLGIKGGHTTLADLCASDVDAICVFTPPWLHAQHTLEILRAGKHVCCAVPAALTIEELKQVVDAVTQTGLTYMTAETSYYYPSCVYCRDRFRRGDFGRFVYGQAEYYHHPSHYGFWSRDNYSTFPPMLYATHSIAMIVGVTGSRLTSVSALGIAGFSPEAAACKRLPQFRQNPFGNESAIFRMANGGACRINEFRHVGFHGPPTVRCSVYGSDASYEEVAGAQVWSTNKQEHVNLTDYLGMSSEDFSGRLSPAHPQGRLPKEFAGLPNYHFGSHQFLVDDFVNACVKRKLPPNHVWQAAKYCAPGIVAHASALEEGRLMAVPDFGEPHVGMATLYA